MARKHQRGWLRIENRRQGQTWVLRFYATRQSDGKRVERTLAVGTVRDFPSQSAAWAEIERQHLHQQINQPDFRGRVSFAELGHHFVGHELSEAAETVNPKAPSTLYVHRHIVNDYLIPRWGQQVALGIEPLSVERWLTSLRQERGLAWPTLDKIRRVMSLVYVHGQRYGLIPRGQECNPLRFVRCKTSSEYSAMILTPGQVFAILLQLPEPERTLVLLVAATGLRISEGLGLQWQDVDFENQRIHVRRGWVNRQLWEPKTNRSRDPVPLHRLLADAMRGWQRETAYSRPTDWVFPSTKLKGKKPRVANMLVSDYLRPAAVKAGVLADGSSVRFGFHNLRHSLASFLVRTKTDIKTVQSLLRHANVTTTLGLYAHSIDETKLAAQGEVLAAILQTPISGAVN